MRWSSARTTCQVRAEMGQTATGWNRTGLSTSLSASHGSAAAMAKSFAVSQNADTRVVDMVLVVTAGGHSFLYLSLRTAPRTPGEPVLSPGPPALSTWEPCLRNHQPFGMVLGRQDQRAWRASPAAVCGRLRGGL